MSKAFNKSDKVTFINDWDRKGTFYFQHAVVYSCGNKQMVLTDATSGEEMGRHYAPEHGEIIGTFPRMTDEEATAHCLKAAADYVAAQPEYYERMIKNNSERYPEDRYYEKSMRADLEKIHEPRAHNHQS